MVTEVAPALFRGERFSGKVRREALQPKKLEERLPRPALAVDKEILERDRMDEGVALRDAELPREAIPHVKKGLFARVPFLDPGPVRGCSRLVDEHTTGTPGARRRISSSLPQYAGVLSTKRVVFVPANIGAARSA